MSDSAPEEAQSLGDKFAGVPPMADALRRLDEMRTRLEDIEAPEGWHARPRDSLLRLVAYLEAALTAVDPLLVTVSFANEMYGSLNTAFNALDSYENAPSPEHYDQFTDFVRRAMVVGDTEQTSVALTLAAEHAADAAADLGEKSATLAEANQMLQESAAEATQRLDALVADNEDRLREAEATWDKALAEIGNEGSRRYEEDRVAFVQSSEEAADLATKTLEELRRLLSIAGDESLSAGYGQKADDEQKTADDLRGKAVAYGIATAVAAGLAVAVQVVLILAGETGSNWSLLPVKAAFIAALAAIATYYGRQSAHHRSYSQQLRNAQLELSNIGPYLAELDVEDRTAVKRELVNTFFGKPVETVSEDSPTAAANVDQMLELVRLLVGAKK